MKPKYKIGDVFKCFGKIIVITKAGFSHDYKKCVHLYMFQQCRSGSISDVWPHHSYYDESDLDNFKKIEI